MLKSNKAISQCGLGITRAVLYISWSALFFRLSFNLGSPTETYNTPLFYLDSTQDIHWPLAFCSHKIARIFRSKHCYVVFLENWTVSLDPWKVALL